MTRKTTNEELQDLAKPLVKGLVDSCQFYASVLDDEKVSNRDITDVVCSSLGIALTSIIRAAVPKQSRPDYLKHIVTNIENSPGWNDAE